MKYVSGVGRHYTKRPCLPWALSSSFCSVASDTEVARLRQGGQYERGEP